MQTCPGPRHYDMQEVTHGSIDLKCSVTETLSHRAENWSLKRRSVVERHELWREIRMFKKS